MADYKMLAIDLGASSGRGIVGHFDGKKLTLEENHRFSNESLTTGGLLSWDILRIFYDIKASISKCALSEDRDIASIGIDTWGVDYGLLDKNGRLLANPVNYRDSRTNGMTGEFFASFPRERYYSVSGIQVMALNTMFQLAADKKYSPELLDAARELLFIPDLLNYFLTGNRLTEYTEASTSALLDARGRVWSDELIAALGVDRRLFGDITMPGTHVGGLLPELREELGGGIGAEIIQVASHDTASAIVAVPSQGEDFVYISSGTWSLMGAELSAPCINDKSAAYNFTNEGGAGGRVCFLKNIMGLWLEQESRRQWAREGESVSFNELSALAAASKPLACLIDPDAPEFVAPGNIPRRIREFCRRTGQYVPETKGEIVRCIFDSLALAYRRTADMIDELRGKRSEAIHIVGGGTKEELLSRLTADASGRTVYAGPVEATAIGNLSMQAIAAGKLGGIAEAREMIADSFEIKRYESSGDDMWNEGYARFLAFAGK